jgi:hypothetical protein
MQKATAECRAQVKDYAQYHETSWYQRHNGVLGACQCAREDREFVRAAQDLTVASAILRQKT